MIFIEENNDISLFIPETLIENKTLSNYSIAVYCVLHALSIPAHMPVQCVTQQQLEFYLTGQVSKRRRISDYIRCGLQELIDNGIIEKENEIQKHYILDCSKLWINVKKDKFTTITFNEVKKIFQIDNTNNFLLLRYFVLLIGTISSKITVFLPNGESKNRVVGNVTIDYLSKLSGISERTIIEYNKALEEAGLLYIYRHEDFIVDDSNNIKRMSNIYGRLTNSTYIDKFAVDQKKHRETYRYLKNNNETANNKRMLAQKYQQLLKGKGENYSKSEILSIYYYVLSENKKYEKLYEKNNYDEYLEKIRSVDVFEKYDFIEMEN